MADIKIKYKRVTELDYFNAAACLVVILIHILGIGIGELEPKSFQMAVIYVLWRLSQFVVPAFLFSGAVKMSLSFNSSFELSYGRYVAERCRNILLPYVIFSVIYYVVFIKIGYIKGSFAELFIGIITGGISGHFYYIIVVMQFYLLRPVWKKLVSCVPWYISVLCTALISFFTAKAGYVLQLFGIDFIYTDKIFLLYIFFWTAGLYAGRHYDQLHNSLKEYNKSVYFSGIFILFCTILAYIQFAYKIRIFELDNFKLITDTLSIFILLEICITINIKGSYFFVKLLEKINESSYFVYLCHSLFITAFTFELQISGIRDIKILLTARFLIGYTMPFILYFIVRVFKRMRGKI